jgi:hypothetical protein
LGKFRNNLTTQQMPTNTALIARFGEAKAVSGFMEMQ